MKFELQKPKAPCRIKLLPVPCSQLDFLFFILIGKIIINLFFSTELYDSDTPILCQSDIYQQDEFQIT